MSGKYMVLGLCGLCALFAVLVLSTLCQSTRCALFDGQRNSVSVGGYVAHKVAVYAGAPLCNNKACCAMLVRAGSDDGSQRNHDGFHHRVGFVNVTSYKKCLEQRRRP